jgi:vancomycin resistance protein YoaR
LLALGILFSLYNFSYARRILPNVFIASTQVSGLEKERAVERIVERVKSLEDKGIALVIDGDVEVIDPRNIDLRIEAEGLVERAFLYGRSGKWYTQLADRITAPFSSTIILGEIAINEEKLKSEIALLARALDVPRKDIRLSILGTEVTILFDTKPGKVLNQEKAKAAVMSGLRSLDLAAIILVSDVDAPVVDPLSAYEARTKAQKMIQSPLALLAADQKFLVARETIGSWIESGYEGSRLIPRLNRKAISEYVVQMAEKINITSQNPTVVVENGKVVEFRAPRAGRTLRQDETVRIIEEALTKRISEKREAREIALPVVVKKPKVEGESAELGIGELIGRATTPFTGSPTNRIHNLTNGVRFLSGILVPPNEEFSTLETLGNIDNTTGYLPELVIKGDETVPEFGGGLCQVSTTLFRAVMNAGLPVTARRNHSYRVPYYERDGAGNFIGPGLDATIYSPNPDFRFRNDTGAHILIQGFVKGDKATFELYGTSDGRKSFIDGPHILEETPPGEPVYVETDTLPKGATKKIDTAHKGGSAVATYKIEYPDGSVTEKEFKSFYRRWSDNYLVGTATTTLAL